MNSLIKKVSFIPNVIPVHHCDIHGTYQTRYVKILSSFHVNDFCNDCRIKNNADEELRVKAEKVSTDIESKIKRKELALINAGVSKRNLLVTFDSFTCKTNEQNTVKTKCIDYVNNFPTRQNMILIGGVGVGKTLLSSIVIGELALRYKVKIAKLIDIVMELKDSWRFDSKISEVQFFENYKNLDLLIIDEVGSQFGTLNENLCIDRIIDSRYEEMKPTILISNLDLEGIKKSIGERCIDRLSDGGGETLYFNGKSERG